MKILVIVPNPFFADRGFSIRVYNEIIGLQKKGHKLLVVAYNSGRDMNKIKIKRIPNIPGYGEDDTGAKFTRIYLDMFLFFVALSSFIKFKPDIIYAHLHEGALIGLIIKKFFSVPVILDLQGSLIRELRDRSKIKNKLFLTIAEIVEKYIYKNMDYIIYSSPVMEDILIKDFKVKKEKIEYIPDCVDVDLLKNIDTRITKKMLNIPDNKTMVIYSGVLSEYHGTDCLIEAIRLITRQTKDIYFVIIGYPYLDKYKKISEKLGVKDFVRFLGKVKYEDSFSYFMIADIAVAPKLGGSEGNLKLGNYMVCNLPIVCFDTPVNREILGDYGVYAKVGDINSLAEKILLLHNNKKLRSELGNNLYGRVKEKYPLEKMIEKIEQVCFSLVWNKII